jgi:hypothetical protein
MVLHVISFHHFEVAALLRITMMHIVMSQIVKLIVEHNPQQNRIGCRTLEQHGNGSMEYDRKDQISNHWREH